MPLCRHFKNTINMTNYYQQLLILTQSMLLHSEQKDWESFSYLEVKRQQLIEAIKKSSTIESSSDIDTLKEIVSINKRLTKIADTDYKKHEQSLLEFNRNLKKSSLYNNK